MNQTGYYILILFIMAVVVSSGCIVPTKNQPAPIDSVSGGTNYLVPGTGSAAQQQSPVNTQNQGASSVGSTPTPIPDDTRYLTQVPTYAGTYESGPTYRNLSMLGEPTPISPLYLEIYHNELSLKDYTVAYTYELNKPPLIINFDIKPRIDSRTIWYESRTGTYNSHDDKGKRPDVFVTTAQLSPNAWFEVIVRDKLTGEIVLVDGYGRNYGGEKNRVIQVRSSGNYQIDMSGNEVNVTVRMQVINGTT